MKPTAWVLHMRKIIRKISVIMVLCFAGLALAYYLMPAAPTHPQPEKSIVDIHVHVAGLGYGESGCFINSAMRENFRFPIYLRAMGVTASEIEAEGDQILVRKVSQAVAESRSVSLAVILAMDGVIDDKGELDRTRTQIYVPNDYVATQTAKYDNLLFGASINPNRPDAVARLREAHALGAVLIKWIPSIMDINPADEKLKPFYLTMKELGMPLLTHTGMEKSFSHAQDDLADPKRLVLPLSLGVRVIAAHIATTGMSEGQDNFQRILPMFHKYENLYADISSLTQVNKLGYLKQALDQPHLRNRLIYGSDWPLQFFPLVSPWYHLNHIDPQTVKSIKQIENQWDRDVALKRAMGVNNEIFMLGKTLLPQ